MSRKDDAIDNIRKWSYENYDFLIQCMYNFYSTNELEEFAEFVEEENQ